MKRAIALLLGAAVMTPVARAQPVAPADWPRYARDMGGTRFSPLTQINTANVSRLAPAWSFRVRPEGGGAIVTSATPIAIAGILYLPIGDAVVALDGSTGKLLWRHPVTGGLARRAVSWWSGDKAHGPRIYYSNGPSLFALDARTGTPVRSFGKDGAIPLDVPYAGPPTIYQDVLIVGANTQEMQVGQPGNTRAFSAVTGARLWEFNTVPQPGETGHETWLDDGWKGRSGTNVWIWYMTLDEKTGTLYMPVGGPSANYYGGDRKGANLFGNSVVALDARTGKYKWHFQTIHHDLWDSDLPAPPVLVDLKIGGKTVPALAETGKPGFMYILDRTTGKPVHGVDEEPVAAGDVPGEWYAPTQPIPRMPDLVRHSWSSDDIVTAADTNETHVAACRALLASYGGTFFNSGPFTPFFLHEDGGPVKASINLPNNGGSNWGGSAADPRSGLIFINVSEGGSIGFIEKRKDGADYGRGTTGSTQQYDRASLSGPGAYSTFSAPYKDPATGRTTTMPCIRPPWGRLIAVDGNSGKIAWATRLGVTEALGADKQATGRNNTFGGPIVTAGGLVFIGATDDRRFRAFDAKTGKEVWSQTLGYHAQSVPITYRGRDGRQYVAVVAAAGSDQSPRKPDGKPANEEALLTFALPR